MEDTLPDSPKLIRSPTILSKYEPRRKYTYIIELPDGKTYRASTLINDNGTSLYESELGRYQLSKHIEKETSFKFWF